MANQRYRNRNRFENKTLCSIISITLMVFVIYIILMINILFYDNDRMTSSEIMNKNDYDNIDVYKTLNRRLLADELNIKIGDPDSTAATADATEQAVQSTSYTAQSFSGEKTIGANNTVSGANSDAGRIPPESKHKYKIINDIPINYIKFGICCPLDNFKTLNQDVLPTIKTELLSLASKYTINALHYLEKHNELKEALSFSADKINVYFDGLILENASNNDDDSTMLDDGNNMDNNNGDIISNENIFSNVTFLIFNFSEYDDVPLIEKLIVQLWVERTGKDIVSDLKELLIPVIGNDEDLTIAWIAPEFIGSGPQHNIMAKILQRVYTNGKEIDSKKEKEYLEAEEKNLEGEIKLRYHYTLDLERKAPLLNDVGSALKHLLGLHREEQEYHKYKIGMFKDKYHRLTKFVDSLSKNVSKHEAQAEDYSKSIATLYYKMAELNHTRHVLLSQQDRLLNIFKNVKHIYMAYQISRLFKWKRQNLVDTSQESSTATTSTATTTIETTSDTNETTSTAESSSSSSSFKYEGGNEFVQLPNGAWIDNATVTDYQCQQKILDGKIPDIVQQWHITSGTVMTLHLKPEYHKMSLKADHIPYALHILMNDECSRDYIEKDIDSNPKIIQQCVYYGKSGKNECRNNLQKKHVLHEPMTHICAFISCNLNDKFYMQASITISQKKIKGKLRRLAVDDVIDSHNIYEDESASNINTMKSSIIIIATFGVGALIMSLFWYQR